MCAKVGGANPWVKLARGAAAAVVQAHPVTYTMTAQRPLGHARLLATLQMNRELSRVERMCLEKGLKMTEQRRVIAQVLSESDDHPDADAVYRRATQIDPRISLATVYRTVRLFEEARVLERHDFGHGRARYEEAGQEHHDHLIDVRSGKVIEFQNEEIERLQRKVAKALGYRLVDHRLELYAVPIGDDAET